MKKSILLIIVYTAFIQLSIAQSQKIVVPGGAVDPYHYTIEKSKVYTNAAVACAHPLASTIGAEIMKQGGNAFDAAIAVQLALAVVYTNAGNIGGGGFLVAKQANGKTITIDYRETAPKKASRDMYLDEKGNALTDLSLFGHKSCGVPGTVAGLFATLPYAALPFKTLIQPAIDLAEFGYSITEGEASSLNATRKSFEENSTAPTALVKKGEWKAGDTLVQRELAETLKRIQDKGAKGFYEGKTADLIVAEMKKQDGLISKKDLKNYTAKIRSALEFRYKDYTVISMAPPSSGGIILCQLMKIMETKPVASYGFQNVKSVQLMVEAERRAFADRSVYMGDPDFWKVPVKTLTSDTYIQNRMADFDSTRATPSTGIKAGNINESEETTHISIIDKEGNMVSITTTLNNSYGSRTVVFGAGFLLNDEMDDFSIKPGVPNMYGAIGGEANAIHPGKRMLSSMTPTLVLDKNMNPLIIAGTPGGTTIPTSVFQTLINILEFGMNASEAINKPKFHHQWLPDEVMVEKEFDQETIKQLRAMGYTVTERGQIGRMEVIRILPDGRREVAADPRGDDAVNGF
ncbi:MAG: gamma-glutamyltransferase [Bacteroidales bacterium]|nr:gamma-glutamyltransferase [Bacteroidales bacterium]